MQYKTRSLSVALADVVLLSSHSIKGSFDLPSIRKG